MTPPDPETSTVAARAWQSVDQKRWEAVRRQVLDREGWQCRICGRGVDGWRLATSNRRERENFVYDLDRLQALCRVCHIRKTGRKR